MKFNARNTLLAALLLSSNTWSADTFVNVFFNSAPLQGVEVKVDGESIGTTDVRGNASVATQAGEHTVELFREGVLVADASFRTGQNQDAEISITFSDNAVTPKVKVAKFDEQDSSAVGFLGGIVSSKSDVPVSGATLVDNYGQVLATTNEDGSYEMKLPRGEHTFEVKHESFKSATIESVRVFANLGVIANVTLPSKQIAGISIAVPTFSGPLEEVLTVGTYKPTESSIGLERFSTNVVDALDIEQMARFGDSNVAVALTRLVGVTVTSGKYANVRGLDGRYISTTLNGLQMPSTDPFRRDVQLDLFPANILQGIEVQKSYSSDLPGSTTGGILKIKTRGLPDERSGKFKLKLGGNNKVTGKDIISHRDSSTDWLTYDSGLRTLSQDVLDVTENGTSINISDSGDEGSLSPQIAAAYALAFEDDYNVKNKKANPELGLALSFGDITDSGLFGYYGALNYDYDTSVRSNASLSDTLAEVGPYQRAVETFSIDGYLVLGTQFRTEDEVLSKTIVLRESELSTRVNDFVDFSEGNFVDETTLQWTERHFASQQFSGKHVFDIGSDPQELNWAIGYSNTNNYQPDRRSYVYLADSLILNSLERRWTTLDEDSIDASIDYTIPFVISSDITADIKVGSLVFDKERDFEVYRFGWSQGRNLNFNDVVTVDDNLEDVFAYSQFLQDDYRLDPKTTPTDSYNANEEVRAFYINSSFQVGDAWTIALGARQEEFEQELIYPNQTEATNALSSNELLPFTSLTFSPSDSWQFRASASQTVSYPGMTERSESRYFDEDDREVFGNPGLEISFIDNIDLRIEYYLSDDESISLAFFNKEIDKPTEKAILDGSGSSVDGYTFRQSESASLFGVELDGSFTAFETSSWLSFISGNLTYIDSEINVVENSTADRLGDVDGRALQGQSKYLANLQFGFDHFPLEQKFTLLISYFDDRIFLVNRGDAVGQTDELGRISLNFNYEKSLGDSLTFKAQFKNLLDEKVQFSINDRIVESFNEGISYSMDLSWEF